MIGILAFAASGLTSCSDKMDESSYYSFTGKMMSEYLKSNAQYSQFAEVVERAGLMDQLSAYGHYTCFVPTNDAMNKYLAEQGLTMNDLTKEDCDTLARTHLLTAMYSVMDLPEGMLQNMMRRNLQFEHKVDENNNAIVVVNSDAVIFFEHQDDSVENGIMQPVSAVITNSTKTVASLISKNETTSIFYTALHETGLEERMEMVEDLSYNRKDWYENNKDYINYTTGGNINEDAYLPQKRLYGFTAFIVPDKVLKEKYPQYFDGIRSDLQALYMLACDIYDPMFPDDVNKEEHGFDYLDSPINPLYRFMAYHVLDRNVQGYDQLTVRGDAGVDKDLVNTTDWYTTLLPHTMVKVEHINVAKWLGATGILGDRYLNRRYDDKYSEEGVHIQPKTDGYVNNGVNGMYFYIDDVLKFDETTRDVIQNCRIRMDFSTIFPEIMSNNIRMNGATITEASDGINYFFPDGYLDGVVLKGESHFIYRYPRSGYYSMHGDEMIANKAFDITFNLPPVPYSGTWQIRLGFAPMNKSQGAARGQVQIYIDDKAEGIPLNMEERLNSPSIYGTSEYINYFKETKGDDNAYDKKVRPDEEKRSDDFKILKNKGYYRGPYSVFNSHDGTSGTLMNRFTDIPSTVRKVLCTVDLKAGETHTIRIKNVSTVLPETKEAMLDYLELVPKSVFGVSDGDDAEDDL